MFDPPNAVAFNQIPIAENNTPQHRELARRAARESIVLLKNQDGILPFKSNIKTLAVIGPNAESLPALEGNYNGTSSHPIYPVEGIRKVFAGKAKIIYAQGSTYVEQLPVPVPSRAFQAAGGTAGLKGEYFSNPDFAGKPVYTREDSQVQFNWDAAAPVPGLSSKSYAVRWTGRFAPPGAGDYVFTVQQPHCYPCDDAETVHVYLDGHAVLDTVIGQRGLKNAPRTFQVRFADDQPHDFAFEYAHDSPHFAGGITLAWQPPAEVLRNKAVAAAQQADAVVAFVGLSPDLEGEEMPIQVPGFHGGDRTDIALPEAQQQLLEAVAATGKPLVVVLMSGSALAVNWAQEHAAAVLEAWYPGEEGGTAIAETLAGMNNPSGRLPVTFYASVDQLPPFEDYSMQNRTYRYFQGKPLYGFGYGLSYSSFEYSNLKLSPAQLQAGAPLSVQVDVRNTSKVAGDEVAELYLEFPSIPGAPARALRGFARVRLPAGESRHVTYTLNPRDLSMVNEQGEHLVVAGEYTVFVGGSQPGDMAKGVESKLTITGETKLPR
jgi:beta-glucosidase